MFDLPQRLTGLGLLLASGGSTLVHRSVYEAAKAGPARAGELVLGLTTIMLASTGILLLIHGSRLLAGRRSRGSSRPPAIVREAAYETDLDTREGVAWLLAGRAISTAAGRAAPSGEVPAGGHVRDAA